MRNKELNEPRLIINIYIYIFILNANIFNILILHYTS